MRNYWIPGQMMCGILLIWMLAVCSTSASPASTINAQASKVCYDHIGCFEPFEVDPDMPLPMSPEDIGTAFLLHTNPEPETGREINATLQSIEASGFNFNKKTKVIIHGFAPMQSVIADFVPRMMQAILAKEDANVIIVDWVNGANIEYDQSAQNTRVVGALTAHLLRTISNGSRYDPKDFHVIGFSLGAHVAGFTGKEFRKHREDERKIGRITGLDPANPGFNFDDPIVRLDRTDAEFVDVLHTDIRTVLVMAGGMNRNLGDVDFYPNGGNDQPGCNSWQSLLSVSGAARATVCDHMRAPEYFIASINNTDDCNFAAYKCKNYEKFKEGRCVRCLSKEHRRTKGSKNRCQKMGYWAQPTNTKKQVQYYLQTSEAAPFCAKHYQIQIHWRKTKHSTEEGFRGRLYITLHGAQGSTKEYALNDAATFHIVPGNTSRFLVSHDCSNDIGTIEKVTFRWERPTCWTYYFCKVEDVYLKRLKIFDASAQKRHVFLPLKMDRDNDGRKDIIPVPAGENLDLHLKSFIREHHRENFVPVIIPALTAVRNSAKEGKLIE